MKSITLFFTLLLAQIMILSQPCPDSLYLTRQTQIDSFQIIYPMCSEIEGNVYILNDDITNLNGLNNLTSIGGTISILRNSDLNSLSGIENIDPGSIQGLNIHHNPSLSWCAVLSICNYLANPIGMAYIGTSNSYGCQSTEEVLDSCEANSVAIVENHLIRECMVSPNPFKGFTTFSYILEKPSKIIITIYNPQGQIIDKIHQGQAKGKQKVQWNAAGLSAGMYYYRFQAGNRDYMGKVIAR